ncbi:MAG: hypothetical protein SPI77_02100 [Corynebacterium sp.]|nr:hypothetical protein [Corynebacterium sp.]
MGRLLLLILIIVAAVLVWKAFGPGTWGDTGRGIGRDMEPEIKGPDDDEEFLWKLEKEQFKKRRAAEEHPEQQPPRRTDPPDPSGSDGTGPQPGNPA